jgi:hypothetical protein
MSKIKPFYIITGKRSPAGEQNFWAIDNHSGGWPWWSDDFAQAEKFNSISKALRHLSPGGYMLDQAKDLKVVQVNMTLVDVDSSTIIKMKRDEALAKLTKDDRVVLGLE